MRSIASSDSDRQDAFLQEYILPKLNTAEMLLQQFRSIIEAPPLFNIDVGAAH
jgi:hypothetical protein